MSSDTLTGMFDMATESAEDNALCSINSASIRLHADVSKKLNKKFKKANKRSSRVFSIFDPNGKLPPVTAGCPSGLPAARKSQVPPSVSSLGEN